MADSSPLPGYSSPLPDEDFDEDAVDDTSEIDELLASHWEPPVQPHGTSGPLPAAIELPVIEQVAPLTSVSAPESFGQRRAVIVPFPLDSAGAPLGAATGTQHPSEYHTYLDRLQDLSGPSLSCADNRYAPFQSQLDWQVAQWAKLRGPGSTAFSELLAIEGVSTMICLMVTNSLELNQIVDKKLPAGRPSFKREEIVVAGEAFDVYFRDIIECVKALYGDAEFAPYLIFKPERHYEDQDETRRLFHDMHTGRWWWDVQVQLEEREPGATIIPIIISSDKTQLTLFRNKSAYPIYLTIGNIPKDIRRKPSRRAQILLGYLPTSRLEHIPTAAARRRALANLFHACVDRILSPIKEPGVSGLKMRSGDGVVRRCHPIFAIFIGDYPEQCLVACTKHGVCPKGNTPNNELGDDNPCVPRDLDSILDALDYADDDPVAYNRACLGAGIKPVYKPFWQDLPFTNIFLSITPDVLHQLYQGVMKHAIAWVRSAFGDDEIDARC
ncbi:hypothetical protein FA95DRAFT_1506445, partial [Auriscalpium vulgare]